MGGTAALGTHLAKPVEEDSIYGNIGDYVPTTLAKTAQGADKVRLSFFVFKPKLLAMELGYDRLC